jgi:NDP-sugar pyrophosphorylase family protein
MNSPTLVIMAAGLGSRYGGLKQIDPVGPNGEIIIDYSIYDAIKAGFKKIVFVIKEDKKEEFHEKLGAKIEKLVETEYVFQRLTDLPKGIKIPDERVKPWGTAHAVLSCKDAVKTPFAVINADDFYGYTTFKVMHDFLAEAADEEYFYNYCMAGFLIENTLTEHGHVARGVCSIDDEGFLTGVKERTQIKGFKGTVKYTEDNSTWIDIPKNSIVSMNIWGFTPSILSELEIMFPKFLETNRDNLLKAEYFLPSAVDSLIAQKKAKVKVLSSMEKWYGVTYRDDKPYVKEAIGKLIEAGLYPKKLWEDIYDK